MTIRITRDQYAKDLARLIKPDPLEIDPVEYTDYKDLLKQRFMIYVPEDYRDVAFMNTLDGIFDQMISITTQFTRADVIESVKRLIVL